VRWRPSFRAPAPFAAVLAIVLHLPFVLRYDLHFQPDFAISLLVSRSIVQGERPVFWWGQEYLGTAGNYLTAALFRLFGVSVPLAATVSLCIWAAGVALATAIGRRLFGLRAAWWTGVAAAVASPYANHYVTQPYSSYETAPVLALVVIGALAWSDAATRSPRRLLGLGFLLGLGWWTTRLFLPALVAGAIAVCLCVRWRALAVRRTVIALGLVAAAAAVGASPEIVYRLGSHAPLPSIPTINPPVLAVAPLAQMAGNCRQALAALPAYFDGDPRARLPEGLAFARALEAGVDPYAGAVYAPGPPRAALDGIAAIVVAALALAIVPSVTRAWRERNVALWALCLTPVVHLAFIVVSARTAATYFAARRYWFSSLLVFPLLVGNAIAVVDRGRPRALRAAAAALVVVALGSSLASQAMMLRLPDELAGYRRLVGDLSARGLTGIVMPTWTGWVVAGLSGGTIDVVTTIDDRYPPIVDRVAHEPLIALVFPPTRPLPPRFELEGSVFRPAGDVPTVTAGWRWLPYGAVAAR
jgi:hypothetical protein